MDKTVKINEISYHHPRWRKTDKRFDGLPITEDNIVFYQNCYYILSSSREYYFGPFVSLAQAQALELKAEEKLNEIQYIFYDDNWALDKYYYLIKKDYVFLGRHYEKIGKSHFFTETYLDLITLQIKSFQYSCSLKKKEIDYFLQYGRLPEVKTALYPSFSLEDFFSKSHSVSELKVIKKLRSLLPQNEASDEDLIHWIKNNWDKQKGIKYDIDGFLYIDDNNTTELKTLKEREKQKSSTMEIKHNDGSILWEGEASSIKEALEKAIKEGTNLERANLEKANLERANLQGVNLFGANLQGANLSEADLSGADLSGADLSKADLSEADLSGANLSWAYLIRANLEEAALQRANLSGANLSKANLEEAALQRANLSGANLSKANLFGADLFEANLQGANLFGADLFEANLQAANLSWASLFKANLSKANLQRTNLFKANLQRTNLFKANLQGANLSEADLSEADLSGADLSWANLSGANLFKANLEGANLFKANLFKANLQRTNLFKANLQGANLEGANLFKANLFKANLQRTNLFKANLQGANLSWANLFKANLEGTNLERADITGVDISKTNLEGANLSESIKLFKDFKEQNKSLKKTEEIIHSFDYAMDDKKELDKMVQEIGGQILEEMDDAVPAFSQADNEEYFREEELEAKEADLRVLKKSIETVPRDMKQYVNDTKKATKELEKDIKRLKKNINKENGTMSEENDFKGQAKKAGGALLAGMKQAAIDEAGNAMVDVLRKAHPALDEFAKNDENKEIMKLIAALAMFFGTENAPNFIPKADVFNSISQTMLQTGGFKVLLPYLGMIRAHFGDMTKIAEKYEESLSVFAEPTIQARVETEEYEEPNVEVEMESLKKKIKEEKNSNGGM